MSYTSNNDGSYSNSENGSRPLYSTDDSSVELQSDIPYKAYDSKYKRPVKRGFATDDDDIEIQTVHGISEEPLLEEEEPAAVVTGVKADEWPSVLADGWKAYFLRTLHDIFLTSKMNILLLAIPIALIVHFVEAPAAVIFVFSLASLCPLAERIAFVTDEMAKYTNDTFGGLMSATMGNVTELIVSIVAIASASPSLLIVTQLSLVGSIVSNILLVLGMSFLVGGYRHTNQRFSKPAANTNVGLLLLSCMAIILPTIMTVTRPINWLNITGYPDHYNPHDPNLLDVPTLNFSIAISVMMLILYGLLVYYQLFTHRSLFESQEENEEEEEAPVLGLYGALGWAGIITVLIAILSEFIVSSIEEFAEDSGMPIMFVSTILLPIVGNAAEHASAIIFAYRNQMDISLGIAVGSATQIALFVIPFIVVVAAMAGAKLSMDFGSFQAGTLFMSVLITVFCIQTGMSDWLKGALLTCTYFILCCAYWTITTPITLEHPEFNYADPYYWAKATPLPILPS